MNLGELLPVLSGLSLGIVLALAQPSWQKHTRILAAVFLGFISSAVGGEIQISLAYVAVDTLLVALAAIAGYVLASKLQWLRNPG
jgi:hypothetical protein